MSFVRLFSFNFVFLSFLFLSFLNVSVYFFDPSLVVNVVFVFLFCFAMVRSENLDLRSKDNNLKSLFYLHQFTLLYFKYLKKLSSYSMSLLFDVYGKMVEYFLSYFRELRSFVTNCIWNSFHEFSSILAKKKASLVSSFFLLVELYTLLLYYISTAKDEA